MNKLMVRHQGDVLESTLIVVTDTSYGDKFCGNISQWKNTMPFTNEIILWSRNRGYVVEFLPNKWKDGAILD